MDPKDQNIGLHYEGVLEKAGKRFFEGFRKRWFVLEGKDLFYYKAAETTVQNQLGIIDMTRVKSVIPCKMINNSFQIMTNSRTYTFTAPSSQLMTEWISVLRQAMQLESFCNKRARNSIRESVDAEGYEVVSRSSRSNSKLSGTSSESFDEDDNGDDNLYDKIVSSGSQSKAQDPTQGTYESVGSFKRKNPGGQKEENEEESYEVVGRQESMRRNVENIDVYDTVPSMRTNSRGSDVSELGSYGVIGKTDIKKEPVIQPVVTGDIYSQVQKPRPAKPVDTNDSFYAEVGRTNSNISNTPTMPVLIESDVDDDDDDDEEDDSLEEKNIEELKDPLPLPVGTVYTADKIKTLLLEIDGDSDLLQEKQRRQEIGNEDPTTGSPPIPEACEKAFSQLKNFLNYLENTEH